MKVIICGAGQVGMNIAQYLAKEGNDVTVIDLQQKLIQNITDNLDVRGIVGHAGYPDVLESAGAQDADMIIAVTLSDEVNMIACQVGHSLFDIPSKIARIRSREYLRPEWQDLFRSDRLPIDHIISPEMEVAKAINRRLQQPGAFDMIPMADGFVKLVGVLCEENCPILYTPLRQINSLFPDLYLEVMAIIRNEELLVPDENEQIYPDDEVYFLTDVDHLQRSMAAFGHEEVEAHRVLIVGGGNIGLKLAQDLEREAPQVRLTIIEKEHERADYISENLSKSLVLCGDGIDMEILEEAGIDSIDTVVAVTNDDERNILSSLLAKKHGTKRAITLMNNACYSPLIHDLHIDVVVSPRAVTASTILQHVRKGRIRAVYSLRQGYAEVIEAEALETSAIVNKRLKDVKLPVNTKIGALIRDEKIVLQRPNEVIKAGDRVIVLSTVDNVRQIEKLFSVRLDYF